MTTDPAPSEPPSSNARVWLSYAVLAAGFTAVLRASTAEYGYASLEQLAHLEADTPYQYRVLAPLAMRGLHELLGIGVDAAANVVTAGSAFGLLTTFAAYLANFLPANAARRLAPLVLLPLLVDSSPLSTYRFFYPSDVPAVWLVALGLHALVRERSATFFAVFAVGCLNRETIALLAVAYALVHAGRPLRDWWPGLAAQVSVWCAVKLALHAAFADNSGSVVDVMLGRNLALLAAFTPTLAAACGGLGWLLPFAWADAPRFTRRVAFAALPFAAGMLVVANLDELRIWNELAPLLAAPVAVWIGNNLLGRVRESGAGRS